MHIYSRFRNFWPGVFYGTRHCIKCIGLSYSGSSAPLTCDGVWLSAKMEGGGVCNISTTFSWMHAINTLLSYFCFFPMSCDVMGFETLPRAKVCAVADMSSL